LIGAGISAYADFPDGPDSLAATVLSSRLVSESVVLNQERSAVPSELKQHPADDMRNTILKSSPKLRAYAGSYYACAVVGAIR
jgi:hypothetical protein